MSSTPFIEKLHHAAQTSGSWLCVGLDPDPALAPPALADQHPNDWIVRLNRGVIEATRDLVCCYKPNLAFYEAFGEDGWRALRETLRAIPPDVPVIADAKRGDIGNSARGYARALFDQLGVDAATVSPYLGGDSLAPFFAYPDRGVFVLCKTSNPGAQEIQDLRVRGADGDEGPIFLAVARRALAWDVHGTLGLVVGATYPADVAAVRALAPRAPILLPGVGAQAGALEAAVRAGADPSGGGVIVSASRSIMYAGRGDDWQDAARRAALELRGAIDVARRGEKTAR